MLAVCSYALVSVYSVVNTTVVCEYWHELFNSECMVSMPSPEVADARTKHLVLGKEIPVSNKKRRREPCSGGAIQVGSSLQPVMANGKFQISNFRKRISPATTALDTLTHAMDIHL